MTPFELAVWDAGDCAAYLKESSWKDPKITMRHYYRADPEEIARKL